MSPDPVIEAQGLVLGYDGRVVLRDVDITIRPGEFWFLLGPNGSGKTTLLRALLGVLPPRAGRLSLHPDLAGRRRIGVVPQRCDLNPALPTTVREFVLLGTVGARAPGREEQAREGRRASRRGSRRPPRRRPRARPARAPASRRAR